jgi:succinate dehydrogenase (ubiquinone) cytochrome b560 subunit
MMGLGNSSIGPLAKFAVAFPLAYHWLGGVRHTVWDKMPETVTNASVEQSSYALFGGAAVASVGAVMYSTTKKE